MAPRKYKQAARAEQTEANAQEIINAAVAVIKTARRIGSITLDEVASRAGVTVRTILRRYGSRDGLLQAAAEQLVKEMGESRPPVAPGDMKAGMTALLQQYEKMGDLNIRLLEEEDQMPLLHELLNGGRAFHRANLEVVFSTRLAKVPKKEREAVLTALYAATDVYLWKLLRRDLLLSLPETQRTMERLINGVLDRY